jgi:hypothetical protein
MTTKKAQAGDRTLKLSVVFFTDKLAQGNGRVRPKHAWAAGMVALAANPSHGVAGGRSVPFQSLLDLPAAIEKVLIKRGIRLHANWKMKQYMA